MAEAFPTAKRRVNGLGVDTGKRRKTSAFEDDGDEEEDEAPDRKKSKHDDDTDLGNIGFQQSEKRVMTEAINSGEDGIKKYGDTTGKWENDDDDKLEAFNLKEEMDNGYFDDEGVYVRNKEEKADPRDAWLDDFQERHNGKFAEEKQEEPDEEPERPMNSTEKIERQKELCSILTRGENVAMALKRLRKEKETFGRLTDLASELLSAGFFNIFQTPKEDMQDALDEAVAKQVKVAAEKAAGDIAEEEWEYKLTADLDADVHGPFTPSQMQGWADQDYFKQKPVWCRRCQQLDPGMPGFGEPAEAFRSSDEIDMFSMF